MQANSTSDFFAAQRPSFLVNTLFLIGIMVLYPLAGVILIWLINAVTGETVSILQTDRDTLSLMRLSQVAAQVFILALPVILLAGRHTVSKNPFSRRSLAFLGVGSHADFSTVFLAVGGIFLLQPFLHTITVLQDLYVWPNLGASGAEVIRQRDQMDSFIKSLAVVHTIPEFFSVFIVFALTPAVCEELLFRGYIQQNYTRSMSPAGAVFLTGFVFAFFHMSAANLLPLALLGWYIGYIYSRTGSLMVPFIVHFVNNLAALLILYITENGNQVKASEMESFTCTFWWWIVVAATLFLFTLVIRRFSTATSARVEVGE
jgi:uncharacterized protein